MNVLQTLLATESIEDGWRFFLKSISELGYNQAMYVESPGHWMEQPKLMSKIAYYLTNYSESFLSDYELAGGTDNDAVIRYALSTNKPLIWSQPELQPLLQKNNQSIEEVSREHGVLHGMTLPFVTPTRYGGIGISATGVSAREYQRDIAANESDAMVLAQMFYCYLQTRELCIAKHPDMVAVELALKPRELEVLKWTAAGLQAKQVSDKINLSIPAVNDNLSRAKAKLHVKTTMELAVIANQMRLI